MTLCYGYEGQVAVIAEKNICRYKALISSVYEYWYQPVVIVRIKYSSLMACILSKFVILLQ